MTFDHLTSVVLQFAEQIIGLSLICFILELIQPERYSISLRSRLRGLYFMVIYFWIAGFLSLCLYKITNPIDYKPLLDIKLELFSASKSWPLSLLSTFAALLVSLTISDFFYYWFHRLQHQLPFLWQFHSIHHSPRELGIWNNYHHFTEEILRNVFLLLPTTLLYKVTPPVPQIFVFIISLQGIFSHAATRFNFGFLGYFILDSRYHRIHHSIEKKHWNKNFASQLPLWDFIFGTAYFPKPDEWPASGLVDEEEPKNAADYLIRPFRKSWKMLKNQSRNIHTA